MKTPKKFKFMITELSNFDKQWWDANFVSFLFHYYCTFILVAAIIRQTRWTRNAWWLAKANLRPGLQVELIVLIKKTESFLYLCSSSICMYYILMYWVSKQMTRNRWIMVRSALFFCRNERADAHLPRFQGVGLHIIIYCLNLLGSAL